MLWPVWDSGGVGDPEDVQRVTSRMPKNSWSEVGAKERNEGFVSRDGN